MLTNPDFRNKIDDLLHSKHQAAAAPAWFQKNHPQSPLKCVAYFSMEYMLSEALPIYSGGLGNVALDETDYKGFLKSNATVGIEQVSPSTSHS